MAIRTVHGPAKDPKPPIFHLPIIKIMLLLLLLGVGISGLAWVAIAPPLLPQFQPFWDVTHHALDLTLGNMGRVENRISLLSWYLSSISLLAAILAFSMGALTTYTLTISPTPNSSRQKSRLSSGWIVLGISLLLLSADKATGLHHALIHDVLYRFPFALSLKKPLLLIGGVGILIGFWCWVQPVWKSLCQRSKQLLGLAGLCFVGSEMGIEGVAAHFLSPTTAFSAQAFLFPLLEHCIDQIGGLMLVLGLLRQLQIQLGDQLHRES